MSGHPSWIPRLPGMKRPDGATGGHAPDGDVFRRQYATGAAPWDLDRPQPEIVSLEAAGVFGSRVLDVGCGTGVTARYLASRGHEVTGIDSAAEAIEIARARIVAPSSSIALICADVLEALSCFEEASFDGVCDVGFFHALADEQRPGFVRGLAHVLVPGGVYAMLCFSERVAGAWGPRRVSETEIRAAFSGREWHVREVRPAQLHSAVPSMPTVDANLAVIERV